MSRPTPRTDALILRLDDALARHGAKTELARRIADEGGISLQAARNRISRILHGQALPVAEDALLLLEWLDDR